MGVLGLSFVEERAFDAGERALAVSLSRKCAQALERARLYESERAARADAERASALQERLVAIVGHDLRTPLAAITLSAQSLQRRGTLGEREAAAVARVCGGAARMAGIIRDLLDYARTRQGQGIPVRLARLDAGALCRQVAAEARGAHPEATIVEDCQVGLTVQGDADRLHQALANLLGNAIQHGGGQPIEVAARRDGDGVRLSIQNLGPVIEPDLLPHVFEPFRRGTDRGEGIGLGLHIVSEIVKVHGGRVEASSTAEAGTTFAIRLAASGEVAPG
jgi:signal transduction histidine kinase